MLTTLSARVFIFCEECSGENNLSAVVDRMKCPRCSRQLPITPDQWADLFAVAVREQPYAKTLAKHVRASRDLGGRVESARAPVECAVCKAPVPAEAIARDRAGGSTTCGSCGAKLVVRPVPAALTEALHGMTLVGEDLARIANMPEPDVLPGVAAVAKCPSCGGALHVDGRSSAVQCAYCRNMVVLPEYILERFEVTFEPHTFYLVHDDSLPRPSPRAYFNGEKLEYAVPDGQGGLVGVAWDIDEEERDGPVVFALDASFRTRWVQRAGIHEHDRLAFAGSRVLVWSPGSSFANVLDLADGHRAGVVGEAQPSGATEHTLDLSAHAVAVDPIDGSYVFNKLGRLVRCDARGKGVPIWPPHKILFGLTTSVIGPDPFEKADREASAPPSPDNLPDYPTRMREADLAFCPDGTLLVWGSNELTAFDRAGKKLWSVPLHVRCACVDEHGDVYVSTSDALVRVKSGRAVPITKDVPSFNALVPGVDDTLVGFGRYTYLVWKFAKDGECLSAPEEEDDD